jgi:DNA-binding NarL/FixJ family response regulator
MAKMVDRLHLRGFTARQVEVTRLVLKGFQNKEIAAALKVTEKCVKFHLTNIYKHTRAKGREQLVQTIRRWGM